MFCSGTKNIKDFLMYPAAIKIPQNQGNLEQPKAISMFFVNNEVLVKFEVQNLEVINMCDTFVV